jgi:hypothetical protein
MEQYFLDLIASWPPSNYTNPVTRGWGFVIVNLLLLGFLIAVVGMRIYTRFHISKYFGSDDVLIFMAMVSPEYKPGMSLVSYNPGSCRRSR